MNLKTACTRIARAGIKLAEQGDIEGAQSLIKMADYLSLRHSPQDVMDAMFPPENHEKIAALLDEILATPSDVALEKQAAARAEITKKVIAEKAALAKKAAAQTKTVPQQKTAADASQGLFSSALKKK